MSLGRAAEAVLGGSATAGSGAGGSLAGPATVPVFRYITIANTNKPTPSVASTQMVHLTRISALTWLCTLFRLADDRSGTHQAASQGIVP
jgi:hypothetical protein